MSGRLLTIDEYVKGILASDRVVLSRAITLVESNLESDQQVAAEVLKQCLPHSGKSVRIGLTGVPGVGKSTFIDSFGTLLTGVGHKVAVLAVDPSSAASKGSILGDKTRMERLSKDENAFIRPSPNQLTLGGVTRSSREVILLCEAAGFDRIIIETVGVGQSETVVAAMVDFFLLLMLPGAGDELQGIKKGIIEMADVIVINKADGEMQSKARLAAANYASAIRSLPSHEGKWIPPILTCSALEEKGMNEIVEVLNSFILNVKESGDFELKRKTQRKTWLMDTLQYLFLEWAKNTPVVASLFAEMETAVENNQIPATVAAWDLFKKFKSRK